MQGYIEFLDALILFRATRDMDQFPETWAERRLSFIKVDGWSEDDRQYLSLLTKVAELIDDRKADLLKEVEEDINCLNEILRQQEIEAAA